MKSLVVERRSGVQSEQGYEEVEVDEKLSRHVWRVREVELGVGAEFDIVPEADAEPVGAMEPDWDMEEETVVDGLVEFEEA